MSAEDKYINFSNSSFGKWLTGAVGLPQPTPLLREAQNGIEMRGPVYIGGGQGSLVAQSIDALLKRDNIECYLYNPESSEPSVKPVSGLIFDATELKTTEQLDHLYEFFHKTIRTMGRCARAIVVGLDPEAMDDLEAKVVQQGLTGFIRSLGKEMRHGSTAQLIYMQPGAEKSIESSMRFFLSPRSAYVSGQVICLNNISNQAANINHDKPHAGRTVLITGAARGIGAAIAEVFARDGAHIIGLDVGPAEDALQSLTAQLGGSYLTGDITSQEAITKILDDAKERGGYDIVVHNAGITRDKTIANMDDAKWKSVLAVNLAAPMRLTNALLEAQLMKHNGRFVCLSSINGIAGSIGQTNYSLTKAGVIGLTKQLAPTLKDGITINAVAPGFIETKMTAAIPFATREMARRLNSMSQGGLPVDVAETISWIAHPGSGGINGQTIRVCGQNLVGA